MPEILLKWKDAAASFFALIADKLPRLSGFAFFALLLCLIVIIIAPHQIMVTIYKLSLVVLAAWLGYRVDRAIFPYARPHNFFEWAESHRLADHVEDGECERNTEMANAATLRRAIIVAAVILAIAMGA